MYTFSLGYNKTQNLINTENIQDLAQNYQTYHEPGKSQLYMEKTINILWWPDDRNWNYLMKNLNYKIFFCGLNLNNYK